MQNVFGRAFGKYRSKATAITDTRLKTVDELIGGIRVVKMFAWEQPLIARLMKIRDEEMGKYWKAAQLKSINMGKRVIEANLALARVMYFPKSICWCDRESSRTAPPPTTRITHLYCCRQKQHTSVQVFLLLATRLST